MGVTHGNVAGHNGASNFNKGAFGRNEMKRLVSGAPDGMRPQAGASALQSAYRPVASTLPSRFNAKSASAAGLCGSLKQGLDNTADYMMKSYEGFLDLLIPKAAI